MRDPLSTGHVAINVNSQVRAKNVSAFLFLLIQPPSTERRRKEEFKDIHVDPVCLGVALALEL
jgi:hypothetical protein